MANDSGFNITPGEVVGIVKINGRLSLSDTSYFYDEPLIVALESGDYVISVCYSDFDGHKHIATVKVAGADDILTRGKEIGSVLVDFGQIGICDRDAVESAFDVLGNSGMSQYFDQLDITDLVGAVHLPGSTAMVIFRPGFGDGTYPVYELMGAHGKIKGVEIDCLRDIEE